ncbi:MAG TPA: hypothetical protein VIY09_00515 [Rhizomicrobium sp.]
MLDLIPREPDVSSTIAENAMDTRVRRGSQKGGTPNTFPSRAQVNEFGFPQSLRALHNRKFCKPVYGAATESLGKTLVYSCTSPKIKQPPMPNFGR